MIRGKSLDGVEIERVHENDIVGFVDNRNNFVFVPNNAGDFVNAIRATEADTVEIKALEVVAFGNDDDTRSEKLHASHARQR